MKFLSLARTGETKPGRIIVTILFVICSIIGLGSIPSVWFLKQNGLSEKPENIGDSIASLVNILGNNTFLILNLFPFIMGFIAIIYCIKFIHKRNTISVVTARKEFDFKRMFFAFGIWAAISILWEFLAIWSNGDNYIWNFDPSKFFGLVLICLFILPIQTAFEELFFRGYLMQQLGLFLPRVILPIVIQALIFAYLHSGNPEVSSNGLYMLIPYLAFGLFFGIITYLDEGTELAIGFHTANNIFGTLIVTQPNIVFQVDALYKSKTKLEFGIWSIIVIIGMLVACAFLFKKVYKWDWKKLNLIQPKFDFKKLDSSNDNSDSAKDSDS